MTTTEASNQAFRKLYTLRGFVNQIRPSAGFSSTAGDAVEMYRQLFEIAIRNFDDIEDSVYPEFHAVLCARIGPLMQHVVPMNTTDVPWSLIPAIETVLRRELGENFGLLL